MFFVFTRCRRKTGLITGLLSMSILFFSCGSGRIARQATDTPAVQEKAGLVHTEKAVYKNGGRRYEAQRGVIAVPENRNRPGSRLIRLPFFRIFSKSSTPGPVIFYLTGGPGISNMKFNPPESLLEGHDVVMVGYRGVDGSSRLEAPEIKKAIASAKNILSAEAIRSLNGAIRRELRRWEKEGRDIEGYTIVEVMHDLEAVRESLGYKQINLLSESYGTRIALIYARAYPHNIYRSVMIGANPPGRFVWEPGMIDDQIRAYSKMYADNNGTGDSLVRAMEKALENMPESWMGFTIDPGKVKLMIFVMLFHRNSAALVLDACLDAAKGDYAGLALLSAAYDLSIPGMFVWGDFLVKAYSADYNPRRNYERELDPPGAIIGSPLSKYFWAAAPGDIRLIKKRYREPQVSDVPTLIISGNMDFSTPARYAREEILPCLSRGRQLLFSDYGHVNDLWRVENTDVPGLIARYYKTGEAPFVVPEKKAMDFEVTVGLSGMARSVLATGGLLMVGLLAWALL